MNELTIQELSNSDLIRSQIFTIRGVQVILSSDLAPLYDVEVKYLHRQVKRNANRFPSDFVLHLSPEETNALRCQNVTSKRGGDRYGVLAFTEQGVAMLSSVLKSERAAEVNVAIMRTLFNAQYSNSLTVKVSDRFHDRFLIIDKTTLIHVGASLNHLGKKCFAFSSLDKSNIPDILAKI